MEGRDGSAVTLDGREETELREAEEATLGKAGVLDRWGRCPRGKSGSGCFCLRRRRKKLVVDCCVDTTFSPRLLSDLEDSDKRSTGGTKAAFWSPAWVCDAGVPGLEGSSNVTVCLLVDDVVRSFTVALFSSLAAECMTLGGRSWPPLGRSLDRRIRKGIFIRVCFLGWESMSMVGAVVMMAGAEVRSQVSERIQVGSFQANGG